VTHTIARYPVHLIDVVRLTFGRRVTIRPVLPQDAELQRAFFRSLSGEARYYRFMTRLKDLPEALLEHFSRVDYRGHLALLAEVFEGRQEIMVGEARYVLDARDSGTCEFAIAVADAWHGSGLARLLLEGLEREAAASGVRRLVANTLVSNGPMLGLARRAGYAVTANPEDATLARLEKRLARQAIAGPTRVLAA
jgi:acetyltransferase